jgi:hypothetical protein
MDWPFSCYQLAKSQASRFIWLACDYSGGWFANSFV